MSSVPVIRFELAYDGGAYHGWQIQTRVASVQRTVQEVLERVVQRPVKLNGASRTDAGVHARGQVAAFEYPERKLSPYVLQRALNGLLPDDISVLRLEEVTGLDPSGRPFHPRHCARGKRYHYSIWPMRVPNPALRDRAWHPHQRLPDAAGWERAQRAADLLLGEHDFAGFRASDCSATSTVRVLHRVHIVVDEGPTQCVRLEVEGSAFLKYMVRVITGTLFGVATGDLSIERVEEILRDGDRQRAGRTAPPHGLELMEVFYPDFPWTRPRWQMPPPR